jgi:hypothetical protein
MNRSTLALLVTVVVLVMGGCQPALDTNRNTVIATASPAKETIDRAAIEAEVMKLEREWLEAARTHNPEAAKRALADDAILIYPDGAVATKADEVTTIESSALTADSLDILESKVTVISADSAFITGRSAIKNGSYKVPNKKPIDISGEYRFLDVYARRDGKWQAVASQVTKIVAQP